MGWIALPLLLALGFANQRGSTCAVSAADEIVREHRFRRIAGFALAAAVSAAVIATTGAQPRSSAMAGAMAIVGGALAALGVSLNGRCAMGTLASLCRGRLDRIATLIGFFLGAWCLLRIPGLSAHAMSSGRAVASLLLAVVALGIGVLVWRLAHAEGLPAPAWMAIIGLLNAGLLWLMPDWTYTGGLTRLAHGEALDPVRFALDVGAALGGGAVASVLAGKLHLRWMQARTWLKSLAGGMLMGAGSALVPGGNDAMLLIGVPLVLPGLLLAYTAFWLALLGLRWRNARMEAWGA